jgi:hypothetical protein
MHTDEEVEKILTEVPKYKGSFAHLQKCAQFAAFNYFQVVVVGSIPDDEIHFKNKYNEIIGKIINISNQ